MGYSLKFDANLAKKKLDGIMGKLDPALVRHLRFEEMFLNGCEKFGVEISTNVNDYIVSVLDDGKTVMISGDGKDSIDKESEAVYRLTISLETVFGEDNGIKVVLEKGSMAKRERLERVRQKLPDYGKVFLSVYNLTSYYNCGGIEMSRSEFSEALIPLECSLEQLKAQTFNIHKVKCGVDTLPTKSFCNSFNRYVMYRHLDNLGLIRLVKESKTVQQTLMEVESKVLYGIAGRVYEHPESMFLDIRYIGCELENGRMKSSNSNYNGMLYEDFSDFAKLEFREGLESYVKFRGNADPIPDIANYLLEITKDYGMKSSFQKR